jgi:hypothetical protein
VLSLGIVLWMLGAAASLGKATAPGRAVRTVTGPVERFFGVWQSWGMFGPNPPMGTSWFRVSGEDGDGRPVEVAPIVGELPAAGVRGLYERPVKLERSMLDRKNDVLRRSFAMWRCEEARAEGRDLARVIMGKETTRTPKPRRLVAEPDVERREVWTDYETLWCPRSAP